MLLLLLPMKTKMLLMEMTMSIVDGMWQRVKELLRMWWPEVRNG